VLDRILAPLTTRFGWARTALSVQKRFGELNGGYLASSLTLTAFLSLFPLILVAIGTMGFLSLQHDVTGDVVRNLGLTGEAANQITDAVAKAQQSRKAASVLGLIGLLWSGLALVSAVQYIVDSVWQVSGRGLKDKAIGVLWLVGSAVLFGLSFAVTGLVNVLPGFLAPLAIAASLVFDLGLWLLTFKVLTNYDLPWKALLPGSVFGAIGLEALKWFGGIYVPKAVASSSALYGSLGTVFALLAWLFFFGRLVVYAAVLNVVRWEEDHGTVTAEIQLPRMPGEVPVAATRAGEATP
jgi:membrane protein